MGCINYAHYILPTIKTVSTPSHPLEAALMINVLIDAQILRQEATLLSKATP